MPAIHAILILFVMSSASSAGAEPSPFLLLDEQAHPRVRIAWTDAGKHHSEYELNRGYTTDADRVRIAPNIEAYFSAGGTRLTKGAGHPKGAVVRVGFYKENKDLPFFDNVTADTTFEVTLTGVRFNQPVTVDPQSVVQHLKYDGGDLEACGIPGDARDQFNLVNPRETLNDRIEPGVDARPGALDGSEDSLGSVSLKVEDDASVTMTVRFRYPAFRNLRDPWQSDLPGTFLEPVHFHLEFEALPEGVEPLDPARPRLGSPFVD